MPRKRTRGGVEADAKPLVAAVLQSAAKLDGAGPDHLAEVAPAVEGFVGRRAGHTVVRVVHNFAVVPQPADHARGVGHLLVAAIGAEGEALRASLRVHTDTAEAMGIRLEAALHSNGATAADRNGSALQLTRKDDGSSKVLEDQEESKEHHKQEANERLNSRPDSQASEGGNEVPPEFLFEHTAEGDSS